MNDDVISNLNEFKRRSAINGKSVNGEMLFISYQLAGITQNIIQAVTGKYAGRWPNVVVLTQQEVEEVIKILEVMYEEI